jgi:hypothetical protein
MSTLPGHGNEEITRIGKIFLAEDGIVRVMMFPDVDIRLEDAQEAFAAHLKICQGKRHPLLVDARKLRSFARDARQFFASEEVSRVTLAFALIVDTPVSRVLGNFYLGLNKPQLPTRLFTDEDKALEWLKEYIE